jgi:tetratricopeptide (TPR) repeat protein
MMAAAALNLKTRFFAARSSAFLRVYVRGFRLIAMWFGLALALSASATTPKVGKTALRDLARIPSVSFRDNWSFDAERGFSLGSSDEDFATEIVTERGLLKHDSSDAKHFQRLGELYAASKQAENSVKAFTRAAELYRARAATDPDNTGLLINFGKSLQGSDKWDEAENIFRQAVNRTPDDWNCLVALGKYWDEAAQHDLESQPAGDGPGTARQVDRAQKHLNEAGDLFDRAVKASPEESRVYLRRGLHRCFRDILLKQIRATTSNAEDANSSDDNEFSPAALADLQHASLLAPKDCALIGSTVLFEIYTVSGHKGVVNWADFSWGSLPDKSQRSIRDALTRLENLGQNPDAKIAANALEVLGILEGPILHEPESCINHLRRATALDPSRDQAWEVLCATLAQAGRYHDLLTVCQNRVAQKDSAHNHLLLAKTYEKLKQYDDAEFEIDTAMKLAPNDFTANVGLAALLIHRSQGDPELLSEADGWLAHAEQLIGNQPAMSRNRQQVIDLTLTRSIYFALTDNTASARIWAEAVLKQDKSNATASAILMAMNY